MVVRWLPDWANTQNQGGRVGHGAVLPARGFAYLSARAEQVVADIVAKGIAFLIEVT
jgi:phage gpG-like protein